MYIYTHAEVATLTAEPRAQLEAKLLGQPMNRGRLQGPGLGCRIRCFSSRARVQGFRNDTLIFRVGSLESGIL